MSQYAIIIEGEASWQRRPTGKGVIFGACSFAAGRETSQARYMDKETKPKTDFLELVAWAEANRKRLIAVAVIVLAAAAIIGIYVWHGNAREADANEALSELPMPGTGNAADAARVAAQYARLADTYADTSAGARAMLIGGAMYFDAGQPAKAQTLFEQYLHDHADYPLTGQALIGLAASLETQGKTADAINRYEELLRTRPMDSAVPQAKAALARLYAAGGKPDRALQLYEQLMAVNSSWAAEAQIQAQEAAGKQSKPETAATGGGGAGSDADDERGIDHSRDDRALNWASARRAVSPKRGNRADGQAGRKDGGKPALPGGNNEIIIAPDETDHYRNGICRAGHGSLLRGSGARGGMR